MVYDSISPLGLNLEAHGKQITCWLKFGGDVTGGKIFFLPPTLHNMPPSATDIRIELANRKAEAAARRAAEEEELRRMEEMEEQLAQAEEQERVVEERRRSEEAAAAKAARKRAREERRAEKRKRQEEEEEEEEQVVKKSKVGGSENAEASGSGSRGCWNCSSRGIKCQKTR